MRSLILLIVLAACSEPAEKAPAVAVAANGPVGLYERVGAATPDRICVSGEGASARFGLITWARGGNSCTAKGRVTGRPPALTLAIDGGPACAMSATMTPTGLSLSAPQGPECSYYCGANATIAPGAFVRVGTTPADLAKAVDIAGEPLCP